MDTQVTDVLIIGSGGAGLRAAIELYDNNVKVLVVGKCKKREAHTKEAQGGINAVLGNMDPEDNWELHAADTIADGGEINDTKAVEILCKNAPRAIEELDRWGCPFNKDENGKIIQRFFGAATYRRACFSGSSTGLAILNTLADQAQKRSIHFLSEIYIFSLLYRNGEINGALGIDMNSGKIITFHAKAVILATGGHSRVFRRSSSHFWENTGDGIGLVYELGASYMDMEMFQFHPTGMVFPEEAEGLLITEATRGEGGILTNSKGERFMEKYDPERMELSARDIVARANYLEVEAGRGTEHGGVYLDISHKGKKYILERLPSIYEQYFCYTGKDISKEKMEVGPTAHYSMGGIYIDHATGQLLQAASNKVIIQNLYAIGEVGAGVHGGNRLGGNSLAEILVFGRLVGKHLVKQLSQMNLISIDKQLVQEKIDALQHLHQDNGEDPIEAKKELQQVMWKHVGVIREAKGMETGLQELESFQMKKFSIGSVFKRNKKLIAALDYRNMLPTCEMIIRSALMRTESRAAHYRRDYLETREKWKKNILCTPKNNTIELTTRPIPEVPEGIREKILEERQKSQQLVE